MSEISQVKKLSTKVLLEQYIFNPSPGVDRSQLLEELETRDVDLPELETQINEIIQTVADEADSRRKG